MKIISASYFRKKCLGVLDEVQATGEAVIITKLGKAIVKLVPMKGKEDDIFGFFKGRGEVVGDLVAPVLSKREWGNLA